MVQLMLIRHGVTDWNEQRKYIGSTDLGLSPKGKEQAKATSGRLQNESVDAIFSSKTKRALETAQIIAQNHPLEINALSSLNEVDFGKWEGMTFNEIEKKWPSFLPRWLKNEEGLPPEGESMGLFRKRVESGVEKILARNIEGNIIVVAHAGTIKLFLRYLMGFELSLIWKMNTDSCSITTIDHYNDGRNVLTLLNDTCHLKHINS
jgi:alpha-ribazole phosphatase/probable phosphoglycerate mutase